MGTNTRWAALCLLVGAALPSPANSACCYFSAKDQDVSQPAQKAFLTWEPDEDIMSWTVQPKFEGNAADFGMVIPTPSQPKLAEMPRDFFKELAVFTILKPMDLTKYKSLLKGGFGASAGVPTASKPARREVIILESGVVGSLDYKIISADKAEDLYDWLKENKYNFSGDAATLDHYIQKKWFFTVMKIDPKQMKKNPDGSYQGEVTPTRFQFSTKIPVYPVRITQISVKSTTEALLYFLSKNKADLPGDWSHRYSFIPMWAQALSYALPEKLTAEEKAWQEVVRPKLDETQKKAAELLQAGGRPLTRLEYAKRLGDEDLRVLEGLAPYDRDAERDAVDNLKILKGHLRKGLFLTKIRKVFHKGEMKDDLVFVDAYFNGKPDLLEYDRILPTSPP